MYWQQPGIHGRPLAEAAGLTLNDMLAVIDPAPPGIFCMDCGTELLRTSRSWQPRQALCPDCVTLARQASSRQFRVECLRASIVSGAAVQAPARDWRAASELVPAYPPLSQDVMRGSEADHQEGAWRGWENARVVRNRLIGAAATDDDVVGVAVGQAELLVSSALRIAVCDTARTRDIVDPITHEPALVLLTRLSRDVRDTAQAARERADAAYPEDYEPSEDDLNEPWSGTGVAGCTS
ncbi:MULTISPECIES: hypothetical protein [unclassified Streptomyces]|uniref:hypothetical protein n=1 Tax=unclassified Streptomyces TaxID=2593676 RepID=UPI0015E0D208|nr:hypothetical protein [Streptomyces sp. CB02959]